VGFAIRANTDAVATLVVRVFVCHWWLVFSRK